MNNDRPQNDLNLDADKPRHPNAEGLPTTYEMAERLARVEEKQDHVVETIERVADSLDEDLAELEESHEIVKERNTKLWFGYRLAKWGIGSGAVLSLAIVFLI